jgi:integrase
VQYCYRGKIYRESCRSTHRTNAIKLLRRRLDEIGRGRLLGPNIERTTFEDLAQMILTDYRMNKRKSLRSITLSLQHLYATFARTPAIDITTDQIRAYITARQETGAANSSINRELSALKRMFHLAEGVEKVHRIPNIPRLHEDNVRKGFFEADQFAALLPHLDENIQPLFQTAYITGWRIPSEIATRQWANVDFQSGWLRLEPGETKNKEGRMFPLTPELRAILERQHHRTETLQRSTGQIIPWMFHRKGKPIRNYSKAWRAACQKAGLAGRIPHDFRRTAVRNLERAGVPRSSAMKMVGHKTESVYRRYAIADEGMLRDAGTKLDALHQTEKKTRPARRSVIPLKN